MGIIIVPVFILLILGAIPAYHSMNSIIVNSPNRPRTFSVVVILSVVPAIATLILSFAHHSREHMSGMILIFEICAAGGGLLIVGFSLLYLFKFVRQGFVGIFACSMLFSAALIPVLWFALASILARIFKIVWTY